MKTRFDTEAKGNLEMAYSPTMPAIIISLIKLQISHIITDGASNLK